MWEESREPFLFVWCSLDLQPPAISSMTVQSVDCTSDLSPSALGKPSVSDNGGPNITLTYTDIPGGSCSFQRKWTATDLAGNSASKIQDINLSNLQAPTVIYNANTTIACGSFEERQQDMREAINVTHPCNRPITITHVDSVASIGVRAIFCQGGAVNHLPKKFSQVAQIFTKQ